MQVLHDLMFDWLTLVRPDITWYRAEQSRVPPALEKETFGTYNVINYVRTGIDGAQTTYQPGIDKFNETVFSVKEIIVQIDVYSIDASAEDILNEELVSLQAQEVRDLFSAAGFGVLTYSDIRNLSEVISARYIKRFSVDLSLSTALLYTRQIDRIAEVTVNGDIEPDKTLSITVTDP
jgi:hypothetical protein